MTTELQIGSLTLIGEVGGSHVHCKVLGAGMPGHRPLCGQITVSIVEWSALEQVAHAQQRIAELCHGLRTAECDAARIDELHRVELRRIDHALAAERDAHRQTRELLDFCKASFSESNKLTSQLIEQRDALKRGLARYMPIRSVLGDWDWAQIVEDGCINDDALERAAKAMAAVEAAEKAAKEQSQ